MANLRRDRNLLMVMLLVLFQGACVEEDPAPPPQMHVDRVEDYSGYLVVSNATTRSVVLLNPQGKFVRNLLLLDKQGTDVPFGMALLDEETLLVTVDGVDRVMRLNLRVGSDSAAPHILNGNLAGVIRGITRLKSGDLLISEGNMIERFTAEGIRITSGGWPKALQTTGTQLDATPDGFIHCSTGSDVVRVYSDDGVQTATASSGIAGTTDVTACAYDPSSGRVAVAFAGTTDTIRVYSDLTLTTVAWNFSDLGLLPNPQGIGFKPDGNVIVVDGTNQLLVELSSAGQLRSTYSNSAVAGPVNLLVLP